MTRKYKRPPIRERVISVGASMTEEHFQRSLSTWHDVVRKAFPQSHIANQWQVSIAEKNGVPYIPKEGQKFTTKYQFWKGKEKNRDRGIQVWQDRVAFNLIGGLDNPRTYEDVQGLYAEWFPIWCSHFEIRTVKGVTVEYVNILSQATVPQFCRGAKIDIGKILTAFATPGPLKDLISPFSFEMNFEVDQEAFPLRFHTDLATLPGKEAGLRLLFKTSTEVGGRDIAVDSLMAEIDTSHSLILDEFEAFFTDAAKESFVLCDTDATDSGP